MAHKTVPAFSRRDFQFIADVIRTADICTADRLTLTADFRPALYATNQNFCADKFTRACTPNGGIVVRHG